MNVNSIKTALIVPTVVVILVTGLFVSYLSLQNAKNTVNKVSRQLHQEISLRVIDHLDHFFSIPQMVLADNARLLHQGKLDAADAEFLQEHFLQQSMLYTAFNSLYFGNNAGGLAVGGRESSGEALYKIATKDFKAGPFQKHRVNAQGQREELLLERSDFDSRTSSWYQAAIKSSNGAWGNVDVVFTGDSLSFTASRALHDRDGNIAGVVGGDIFLTSLGQFLENLHRDQAGHTYIIEKSGLLIASSTTELPFAMTQDGTVKSRLQAVNSTQPHIAASARALLDHFGEFSAISGPQSLTFHIEDQPHFLKLTPFKDAFGLSLHVATIVPEKAYTSAIEQGNLTNLYFIFAAFLLMAVIMTLLARWITKPILQLKQQVDDVANGKPARNQVLNRKDEIGELSRAFMDMTGKLNNSFTRLRDNDAELSSQVIALQTEVTKREESERALSESEQRYRETVEQSADLITVVDMEGRFLLVNHLANTVFGVTPEECIGMLAFDFVHPDDRAETMRAFARCVRDGKTSVARENRQVSRDGTVLQISWNTAIQYDKTGKPATLTSIGRDITLQRQTEAQLYQAQKMEAVGQLTGGVAHDFNNLMAVILGNLEESADIAADNPELMRHIDSAVSAVERGASLTHQLLSFSRRQTLNPQIETVNSLIEESRTFIERTIGEDIKFEVLLPAEEIEVDIDHSMFGNTILNLAINARDAMPTGGALTIAVSRISLDGSVFQESGPVFGKFVRISVSDTGIGIAKDKLLRVFEPFFTTKSVGKGSGLGLSMSYGFVNQSNGHMEIESLPGVGTTVSLYLPVADGRTASRSTGPAPQPTAAANAATGETVLVVEDDENVRRITFASLTSLGYRVIVAADGPAACRIMDAGIETVDILFSDVIMPGGMTGFDLTRDVMARHPAIRILLTSGYSKTHMAKTGHDFVTDAGVHILQKPYKRIDLSDALATLPAR